MITLLTKQQTARILGLAPDSLMRLARAGQFPKPIKLGDKEGCSVRFDQAEVEAWIESRRRAS